MGLKIGSLAQLGRRAVSVRLPFWLRLAGLCLGFAAACGIAALIFDTTKTDLDLFFWPSAEIAAHGHPLLVYSVRAGVYPNANGPLSLVPLSLVAAVLNTAAPFAAMRGRDAAIQVLFAAFSLLLAREAVLAVEAGRGRPIHRLLAAIVFLVAPPLWVAIIDFGHLEEPIELWLVLLGVRLLGRERTVWAGACIGLAVLTRSMAVISLIPLLLVVLTGRHWGRAGALLVSAAAVTAIGLLPFWLADRQDAVYSLLSYRGPLPIEGGSFWYALRGASWASIIQAGDAWIFAGAALVLCGSGSLRQPRGGLEGPRIYGLLAVAAACIPMLAKTSWPYYLLDPCVFAAIWWLGRPGRLVSWRALPPLALAVGGGVLGGVQQNLPPPPIAGAAEGIASSAVLAVVIALLLVDGGSGPALRRALSPSAEDRTVQPAA
ncbi:MAG TPA: hypothetical protein VEK76_01320 [Candidatus Binatia bacterium]|nr:hypothetical protein [Candidatus Binatia bacterium]